MHPSALRLSLRPAFLLVLALAWTAGAWVPAARATQVFDDRTAFDAAVVAGSGVVQFEDWNGLSSSLGTIGLNQNPVPPWDAFITGTAIDTGYLIGTNGAGLFWMENAGEIGGIPTSRAFGTNQNLAGVGLDIILDDANVLGVDIFTSGTSTLTITVFDQMDTEIDSFVRTGVSPSEFFGYIGDVKIGRVFFEAVVGAQSDIEAPDNMTWGNATAMPEPSTGLLIALGCMAAGRRRASRA